ncbi:MAG TPA: CPBP family glutamic-type intramembrane protease [Sphingomicrobium sp.]|nr:CPBP family glutamic-type intramembrane protease [Sphingomicrobium sp.]
MNRDRGGYSAAGPLNLLPRPLLEPRRPLVAIATGWVTAFVPSILLAWLVTTLMPPGSQPSFEVDGTLAVFMLVIFAPLVETLIMAGILTLLLRFTAPATAVLVSAALWGIAHSLMAPAWGLVIWWPFLVFSTLFVTWRQRSLLAALAVPATVHALQNLPPALLLLQAQGSAAP